MRPDRTIEYHLRARLRFLTTGEGGRRTPTRTGYRPQFFYNGRDWDAEHFYEGTEIVNPGDKVTAKLMFISPQFHVDRVHVGTKFLCREGARTIAEGEVIEIYPALFKHEPKAWPWDRPIGLREALLCTCGIVAFALGSALLVVEGVDEGGGVTSSGFVKLIGVAFFVAGFFLLRWGRRVGSGI